MISFLKNILSTSVAIILSMLILLVLFIGIIATMSSDKKINVKQKRILKKKLNNTSVLELV